MIKLSLATLVAIYAVMMIYGRPPAGDPQFSAVITETLPVPDSASAPAVEVAEEAEPAPALELVADTSGATERALIAAAIESAVDTAAVIEPAVGPAAAAPVGPTVVVTGSRVNLRAAPAIDSAVLDQLSKGARAVQLGSADGKWIRIRDLKTGVEGYMSASYLVRAGDA